MNEVLSQFSMSFEGQHYWRLFDVYLEENELLAFVQSNSSRLFILYHGFEHCFGASPIESSERISAIAFEDLCQLLQLAFSFCIHFLIARVWCSFRCRHNSSTRFFPEEDNVGLAWANVEAQSMWQLGVLFCALGCGAFAVGRQHELISNSQDKKDTLLDIRPLLCQWRGAVCQKKPGNIRVV